MLSRAVASRFFNGQKPLKGAIQKGILCTMTSNLIGLAEFITTKEQNARHTALLDAFICGFQRSTTLFFGRIVSNPYDLPHFNDWLGYSLTFNGVPFQNGNAMHVHNSVEIFIALSGDFEIGYSNPDLGEIFTTVLKPFDFVAVPAGVYRYYKNVDESKTERQIMTILPGRPSVQWHPEVVRQAKENGADCDELGVLFEGTESKGEHKSQKAPYLEPTTCVNNGDMDVWVRRFGDRLHLKEYVLDEEGVHDREREPGWLEMNHKKISNDEMFEITSDFKHDTTVVVLSGSFEISGSWCDGNNTICSVGEFQKELNQLDVMKLPSRSVGKDFAKSNFYTSFIGKAEDNILMVVTSKLPHSYDFFFHPNSL